MEGMDSSEESSPVIKSCGVDVSEAVVMSLGDVLPGSESNTSKYPLFDCTDDGFSIPPGLDWNAVPVTFVE